MRPGLRKWDELASQSVTNVVLPKPAGAEINNNLPANPASSRSSRRGRITVSRRMRGTKSFVARIIGTILSQPDYNYRPSPEITPHLQLGAGYTFLRCHDAV